MLRVPIYHFEDGDQVEAGAIVLRDGRLEPEPAKPDNRMLLQNILQEWPLGPGQSPEDWLRHRPSNCAGRISARGRPRRSPDRGAAAHPQRFR
jgi:hypothetical protein